MWRYLLVVAISLAITAGSTAPHLFAATHTFSVKIPRKVSGNQIPPVGGPCQISSVRFMLSFVTDPQTNPAVPPVTITGVSLQITEPQKPTPETWSTGPLTTVGASAGSLLATHTFQVPPPFGGVTPLFKDRVNVVAPDQTGYDSARYQRYEIDFLLFSNFVDLDKGTQQNPVDVYTVVATVTTSDETNHPVDKNKFGLCVESYDPLDRSAVSPSCAPPNLFFVPGSDLDCASNTAPAFKNCPATLQVDGTDQSSKRCFKERPGVDAVLVLDKSGSMADTTSSASSQPKMAALQDAVGRFVSAWDITRSNDNTPAGETPPQDSIGTVLFDHDFGWWHDGGLTDGLHQFTAVENTIKANLSSCQQTSPPASCTLKPGTSTSIGGGLLVANSNPGLTQPSILGDQSRHVVVLMTDGIQNTDPSLAPGPNSANPFVISCPIVPSRCPSSIPSIPGEQIYTVTVGSGVAVQPAIIQAVASASGGFYMNTEEDVGLLSPFFLELLQNTLKFNSYETLRLISRTVSRNAPYSTSFPISTTSHDVEFSLMWPNSQGPLRLTVTPPGGSPPIVKENALGFISIIQQIPAQVPFDPFGNWKIMVEEGRGPEGRIAGVEGQDSIPFNIHVMADDGAIKTDLSIVPADYKTGGLIRLRARLAQLGSPILGLGRRPGDKVQVDLVKPGQSIGDILSDSQASANPPPSHPDLKQGAEAKLFNALHTSPSPIKQIEVPGIQLFDDGRPEHGDDVANDGIYSALYPAILPGHYNFLFSVESTDPNYVRFSRQQLRTVYVRAVPDAGNTVFQTSIQRHAGGGMLSIIMTPRVKAGPECAQTDPTCGRMGPLWSNYFWFTAPGRTPFKAIDNLNGTYTATLAFTGSTPPKVSIHFENVLAVIDDSITPDHLPVHLGPSTLLLPDVMAEKCFGRTMSASVLLFLGVGASLVGLAVYRPLRRRKQL